MLSFLIALVSNCPGKCNVLVRAISATGGQLRFDSGSAGAIAIECPVLKIHDVCIDDLDVVIVFFGAIATEPNWK